MAKRSTMKKDKEGQAVGYVTLGVALPTRTVKDSVNRKRWAEFASDVEKAFNELREAGCQDISAATFSAHGIILTAFRPPEVTQEQLMGALIVPQIAVAPKNAVKAMALSKVMHMVESFVGESKKPKEEAVKEAVSTFFKTTSTEDLADFIKFAEEHCEACEETTCADLLPLVLKSLKAHLDMQLC
jgi:esterase/lipase